MGTLSVIITAGGIGKRMNSSLPKQFILMFEKPILMYTIECFYHFDPKCQILITLPEDWKEYWEELVTEHEFKVPHRVVSGGDERYHSIKNALQYCYGDYVAVHDGVRPLVSEETIKRCLQKLRKMDAVIPIHTIAESLREKDGRGGTKAVDRSKFLIVQTPQCFKREVLEAAYNLPYHAAITDDASLVEGAGFKITTVEGNPENIKITTQADLKYAELFLLK
jgi:2-C-methyl-D-erythritol 4-phosphate cytidylyltransferase